MNPKWKSWGKPQLFLLSLCFFCASILVMRLIYLQFIQYEKYQKEGQKASLKIVEENIPRGMIVDREGEILAISNPISRIVFNHILILKNGKKEVSDLRQKCTADSLAKIKNKEEKEKLLLICAALPQDDQEALHAVLRSRLQGAAELIGIPTEALLQQVLNEPRKGNVVYPKDFEPQIGEKIMALRVEGISREKNYIRYYPEGEYMARVLGFNTKGQDGQEGGGLGGMERQFNGWLAGQRGAWKVVQDAHYRVIKYLGRERESIPGQNLALSIDVRLQKVMHQVLEEALVKHQAKAVHGIVVDIKTGEILAMVSVPTANPNHEISRLPELLKNPVLEDAMEPGSTIKPIVMALYLEEEAVSLEDKFHTDGEYPMKGGVVSDTKNLGVITTSEIISKSSNIGMAMISKRLSAEKFDAYMQKLGFGKPVLGFHGESVGILNSAQKARSPVDYARMTYGYNISTTLPQLAQAYAMLANDGIQVPLTLLKRETPPEGERMISSHTAALVRNMMEKVVTTGTGKRAQLDYYSTAGKTGTVHKALVVEKEEPDGSIKRETKGYLKDHYWSSFAGIAPAKNPRIAIVIVLDDPDKKLGHYGGAVAAPQFARIINQSLKLMRILPDKVTPIHHIKFEKEE